MKASTLRKILGLFIMLALAIGLCMFAACSNDEPEPDPTPDPDTPVTPGDDTDDGDNNDTETTYTFEAEYVDLTGITGSAASASIGGQDMISTAVDEQNASNGYYVTALNNSAGVNLTFTITSSAASTAEMTLLLNSGADSRTLESGYLDITVNGTAVTYSSTTLNHNTVTVSSGLSSKDYSTFQEITIGDISLASGENTIVISFNKNVPATSSVINFEFDAMTLKTAATLSWSPITDWDDFYSDF